MNYYVNPFHLFLCIPYVYTVQLTYYHVSSLNYFPLFLMGESTYQLFLSVICFTYSRIEIFFLCVYSKITAQLILCRITFHEPCMALYQSSMNKILQILKYWRNILKVFLHFSERKEMGSGLRKGWGKRLGGDEGGETVVSWEN